MRPRCSSGINTSPARPRTTKRRLFPIAPLRASSFRLADRHLLHRAARQQRSGTGTSFTLTAQAQSFGLTSFNPPHGSLAIGPVTLTITGNEFTPSTGATLMDGNVSIPAQTVLFHDSHTLYATFDTSVVQEGDQLRVQVNDHGTGWPPRAIASPLIAAISRELGWSK